MTLIELASVALGLLVPFLAYWTLKFCTALADYRARLPQHQRETLFLHAQIADQHRREWREAA